MLLVDTKILLSELKRLAENRFGDMVKAVVDVEKEIMVIDADLHSDEEAFLLQQNSLQKNLWGINLYPDLSIEQWIEFDSMINVRPMLGNRSRGIEDEKLQTRIVHIVNQLVKRS